MRTEVLSEILNKTDHLDDVGAADRIIKVKMKFTLE